MGKGKGLGWQPRGRLLVCVYCVGCGMEDGGEVESGVVFGVMCGGGEERVGASCANVCVLIVLRNLLL